MDKPPLGEMSHRDDRYDKFAELLDKTIMKPIAEILNEDQSPSN